MLCWLSDYTGVCIEMPLDRFEAWQHAPSAGRSDWIARKPRVALGGRSGDLNERRERMQIRFALNFAAREHVHASKT